MIRFFAVIFTGLVFTTTVFAQSSPCEKQQCIAIVDAGSTGSRLHIYAYDLDVTKTPIHIKELWNKKITPGFARIEANTNTIDSYLTILLADSPIKKIPIYFYATAGMRLLPQMKQKKYYDELSSWFKKHSEWQLVEAKTITGNEEGLYDWLSVNYHLGNFESPTNKSIGVMDMGGASVQIVFPIAETPTINDKSQIQVNLYGRHYNLYVHSFLGLGQTEMSHQFLNSASCFVNNYPLPDGAEGQGNALSCEQEVSSLMNQVHGVNQLIQPLLAANPVDSWYSIGGISNLADSQFFNFQHSQLTNQDLLEQADSQICHQQWEDINNQYPDDDYVYQYCLFSAYYYALMVDGYGLYPEQTINYLPPQQNIDWTTGVVLHQQR
ncbi:multidrug DMT transporter permease [Legionella sp. km772]|uniref:multidrug DMT transporter permease n=1 Tax=Legionella sp. km772 TaxID=2498111 RepID=UPI000F8CFC15|nr:multidrug DMT transporter permease [Legionella sp. km772]RUR08499.1 multidrug DMT transporter permease [Legionella sp. km772]